MDGRSVAITLLLFPALMATGCAPEATLVREAPDSGLVSYRYDSDSQVLSSPGRREALELMARKCPRGAHIVREGELAKVSRAADRAWRGQMGLERLWGIQFECER